MQLHVKMDFNSHGTAFTIAGNVLMLLQWFFAITAQR